MIDLESEKSIRVPLRIDEGGAVRVGATRVSLLSVLVAFQNGSTAEQILHSFPTLNLTDIYAVIGYYLANRDDLDVWIAQEELEAERIRRETELRFDQKGIRERLLKRKTEDHGDG
jgi:uncharacterized protein (DUF433 family)